MKTAVIYARVSDQKQVEKDVSLPAQLDAGRKKAEELEADVIKEFVDEGKSAFSSATGRQSFLDAIEYCEIMEINYLIVWSSSRFARNRFDAVIYKKRLDENGTKLIYIAQSVDRETDIGRMMDGFLEIVDEAKSLQTSADTTRSMISNARSGYFNGGATPYGFKAMPHPDNEKRKILKPLPEEAEVVQLIFKLKAVDRLGALGISHYLNEHGYTNRGRSWRKKAVLNLLRNDTVIGRIVFGRRSRRDKKKLRPRSEWIIVDSHEPIIPLNLWSTVQSIMDSETKEDAGAAKSNRAFAGLLTCNCGASIMVQTASGRSGVYAYYVCRAAYYEKKHVMHRLKVDETEQWLLDVVLEELITEDRLKIIIREMDKRCGSWAQDVAKRRRKLVTEIENIEHKNSNLFSLLEEYGRLAPNLGDLTKRLQTNNARLKKLEISLKELDAEKAPETTVTLDHVSQLREAMLEQLTGSKKLANAFMRKFVTKIKLFIDGTAEYSEDGENPAELEYVPELMLGSTVVHIGGKWLPGTDSNRRPRD